MANTAALDEVLDAAEKLPLDAQEELVALLRKRLAARGRERILADIRESQEEFAAGKCRAATPDEILREIQS
jgi:hypothetical protein